MVVGILLFAGTAIGLSYAKYDEATTTIIVEDGLKCCVDGKEITGKSTITTNLKGGYLKVCVESEKPAVIGYYGVWYNDVDKQTREGQSSEEVTSYSIDIPFNHGKYDGSLVIRNMGSEAYGAPIHMKIHFDESKI